MARDQGTFISGWRRPARRSDVSFRWEPSFMQRIALISLCIALSGCGFNTWSNIPFTTGSNPNLPVSDSENMQRVLGQQVDAPMLVPEPGDVWPGPLPPEPTLQDLEQEAGKPIGERVPGTQQYQGPSMPPPLPSRGSSTPPGSSQPGLAPLPNPTAPQATSPTPPARNPAGQVYQTPSGPAVTSGGNTNYQTTTTPGGGSSIIVPNGNGTSTIIHSDGRIETVPTPR
jgi:hypothetical protein